MSAKPVIAIDARGSSSGRALKSAPKLAIAVAREETCEQVPPQLPPMPAAHSPLYPTIFHEDWWLDAASHGRYSEVTVTSGSRVVGRLPYLRRSMLGLTECGLPSLVPFLGPAVDEGSGRATRRQNIRRTVTQELIAQLPPCSRVHQRCHGGITDTLPFLEKGFVSRADFTFEAAPAEPDQLWSRLRDKTRNVIRRARESTSTRELEPEAFSRFYALNLRLAGRTFNYMWQGSAERLFRAVIERGRGRLVGAHDQNGNLAAAAFVAWDAATAYLVLTTRAPGSHNGIISRLVWDAMVEAAAAKRVFDFGGVGTPGSVLFYSGFGGEPRPRYVVERATPLFTAVEVSLRKTRGLAGKLLAPVTRTASLALA